MGAVADGLRQPVGGRPVAEACRFLDYDAYAAFDDSVADFR